MSRYHFFLDLRGFRDLRRFRVDIFWVELSPLLLSKIAILGLTAAIISSGAGINSRKSGTTGTPSLSSGIKSSVA